MYGVHPVYFAKNDKNRYMGIFNLNGSPADWWIQNNKETGEVRVNYIGVGGFVNLFIMLDETPDLVV